MHKPSASDRTSTVDPWFALSEKERASHGLQCKRCNQRESRGKFFFLLHVPSCTFMCMCGVHAYEKRHAACR